MARAQFRQEPTLRHGLTSYPASTPPTLHPRVHEVPGRQHRAISERRETAARGGDDDRRLHEHHETPRGHMPPRSRLQRGDLFTAQLGQG